MNTVLQQTRDRVEKALTFFQHELSGVRSGRAHPSLVEGVKADYYGTLTPLKQLASITTPEPMQLLIQVWDAAAVQGIERALRTSDYGFNPSVEGQAIRVQLPPLTEERRQEIVKVVHQKAEATRVSIRAIREETMRDIRTAVIEKRHSEDEGEVLKKDVQHEVDEANNRISALVKQKEEELIRV